MAVQSLEKPRPRPDQVAVLGTLPGENCDPFPERCRKKAVKGVLEGACNQAGRLVAPLVASVPDIEVVLHPQAVYRESGAEKKLPQLAGCVFTEMPRIIALGSDSLEWVHAKHHLDPFAECHRVWRLKQQKPTRN